MIGSIEGKVALVTGGASGIGAACVRALAEAGARVMATDIDGRGCDAVAYSLQAHDLAVRAMQQDVCDEARWDEVIGATVRELGGLDVLVNNAGIYQGGILENNTLEEVNRVHRVNVDSIFLGMKYGARAMKPEGIAGNGGSIINISSVAGMVGVPGHSAYGSTKGGVRLYTKHAAAEFGALGYGIRVNSVHPGLIDTEMGAAVFQDFVDIGLVATIEEAKEYALGLTALGRLGTVGDVANMVLFLASDASSYVTGAEFVVDGGLTAR
jgi:NAD(P)-dependent dehydrogenase (short-subunit alcohol dehydrogenase family)